MKLSEAISDFLVDTRAAGCTSATVESYRRKLGRLQRLLGDVPIDEITVHDLRRYVADLMATERRWVDHPMHEPQPGGLSPATIASYVAHMKRFFAWLVEEELLATNPARRLKQPRTRAERHKAISRADLVRLLNTTATPAPADIRDRAIILFLADTGCRVGGLCGLRIEDVNLDAGLARLREKGGKVRFVPFRPMTARAIRAWLKARPDRRTDALFVSLGPKSRGRLTSGAVGQMLKRRGRMAGCAGPVNPHAFRHAFAREYILRGGDLASLSQLLGHASIDVTASYYARFLME